MATQELKVLWGISDLGETAGQVWRCLRRNGKTSLSEVERQIEAPKSMTHMAIGWLAREGKLGLRQERRSVSLWLTE